jgi:TolB-like protein/Tfp pilus assembly protein PilF
VILYELVTGRVPFEGDTALTIAVKHKTEEPKDPREFNTLLSEDLSRVILKCLEKEKDKRYQSAGEVRSELANIERGIPTTERIVPKKKLRAEKINGVGWKKSFLYGGAAALVILLIVVGFSLITGRQEAMDSIAVLPLENQSGDSGQEYFADGMTDALITELSKIGALRVISRTSVMRYKGTEKLLPEIARELGVDVLVEGSVLHAEDKVRIMVQLIKATPEKHLWADDYERDLNNVIAMQKEIAQAIAREIKITIRPEEQARLTQSRTINPESYQLYLKGRFFWNKRTEEGVRNGLEYFQKAIEKDPTYALAYVGLADSYIIMGWYDWASPQETFPKAKQAVEKALEIDNTLAEAHTSLAAVSFLHEWDWLSAEREFKRAIEINPSHSTAHRWYSSYLASMDRNDEALAESRRALELDPISLITNANAALRLIYSRRPEDAIKQLQKTLEMDPNFVPVYNYLRIAYLEKEMYQEAIDAAQKAVNLSQGDSIYLSYLGSAYAAAGKRDKALEILAELNELSKKRYVSSYTRATIYLSLGDIDQFFEWMERAYLERNWQLTGLHWPLKDSIRSDPRFKALLKKVGLE